MGPLKTAFAATLCVALLVACTTTRVEVRHTEGGQEVYLTTYDVTAELPSAHRRQPFNAVSILLNGPGPVYPVNQVQLRYLNEKGELEPHFVGKEMAGEVRLDGEAKKVTINLGVHQGRYWYPLQINGTYTYQER